jgi:hypothetical protein
MILHTEHYDMDDKITIIEGPPPVFENAGEAWAIGLNEGPTLYDLAVTRLRTFNGPALVERCHHTWSQLATMFLQYRNELGLEETAPIMAARTVKTDEGDVLLLWVRLEQNEEEEEEDSLDSDSDDQDNP